MKIASTHVEQDFLPIDTIAELNNISERLFRHGYGRAKVAGCLQFLVALQEDGQQPHPTSQTEYRKMLYEVAQDGGPRGSRASRNSTRAMPGLLSWARRPASPRSRAASREMAAA